MDEETAELLAGLGGAQAATVQRRQLGEAVSNFQRAFEYYVESGEVDTAVSVVDSFLSSLSLVPASVAPLLTRAMSLVPPDSSQGGRLQSFQSRLLGMEIGDYGVAQQAFANALDIARLEDNEALEMWTSLAAIQRGNRDEVLRQYAKLEGSADAILLGGIVSLDRVCGLLSQAEGRLEDAMANFEAALSFCRAASQPEYAWVCHDYSDALVRRDALGDNERAASLLDEAQSIAQDLEMQALTDRVRALHVRVNGAGSIEIKNSIEAVVLAVEGEQPVLGVHASPDGTVTMLFSDIEGSTAVTERLGDKRAQEVFRLHNALIRKQVAARGGFEVKFLGDGFMVAYSSGRWGLQSAIAIQRELNTHHQLHPDDVIRVRLGLHTGEVIKEEEDFFGKNVILGARIASEARGGQILASSLLKQIVESSQEFTFDDGRDLVLKGLSGTHRVYDVGWQE